MRIGGDSADLSFWDPSRRPLPPWAYALTPRWIKVVRALVHRLGLRLILDLNLITSTPEHAADWVRRGRGAAPRRSIVGLEIGNEPDIYRHVAWAAVSAEGMVADVPLPSTLTADDYAAEFRSYASALHPVAPRVPLLGPALAEPQPHESWITTLLASHPPSLGTVSVHRYGFPGCVSHRSRRAPTIARVLSQSASTGLAASLAPASGRHTELGCRSG